jgi:hypothetical protein
MAEQTVGLTKSYRIDNSTGVGQYVAVVQGAADGNCKIPTGANAVGFVGVTLEAQTNQYKGVAVCKSGIVRVLAHGAIARGDHLVIGSNVGDVSSIEAVITAAPGTASVQNIIGVAEKSAVAGDVFPMFIQPFVVNIAVS